VDLLQPAGKWCGELLHEDHGTGCDELLNAVLLHFVCGAGLNLEEFEVNHCFNYIVFGGSCF
jgi:hypothetical protein